MRKSVKIVLGLILGLLLLMIAAPLIFQDSIGKKVVQVINENIDGQFTIEQADLSLFRDFPAISLGLEKPTCLSYAHGDTTELFKAQRLFISLNLWDVLFNNSRLTVHALDLREPVVLIKQLDSLRANYQIAKDTSGSKASNEAFALNIKEYALNNGTISYIDEGTHQSILMQELTHRGTFTAQGDKQFTGSHTTIQSLTVAQNGIPLLKNVEVMMDLKMEISDNNQVFKILPSTIALNAFQLGLEGQIGLVDDQVMFKALSFSSPSTAFKDLFSLLPNAFNEDFKQVISGGAIRFNGLVEGAYSAQKSLYPNWKFDMQVSGGSLQYPAKQVKLQDVAVDIRTGNSSPDLAGAFFHIREFNFKLNDDYVTGSILMDNVFKGLEAKGVLKGNINLSNVAAFYPLGKQTELSGALNFDTKFGFAESAILNSRYDEIDFQGQASLTQFKFKSPGLLPTQIASAHLNFSPSVWTLTQADVNYGSSDFNLQGTIRRPLNLITEHGLAEVSLAHHSKFIDVTELMRSVDTVEVSKGQQDSAPKIVNQMSISFSSHVDRIRYELYECTAGNAKGSLQGNQLAIDNASIVVNGSQFFANIQLNNLMDFIYHDHNLSGKLSLRSPFMDLDKLMAVPSNAQTNVGATNQYFSLPDKMNLDIDFQANQLIFSPLLLKQLKGTSHLEDQVLEIRDMVADAAGGKMILNGVFEAKTNAQPTYNFKYDIKRMEFKNAFTSFFTIAKLAPVFEYIDGFFNSTFIFQGKLKKDNYPDFTSLNVEGFVETLEGAVRGFKPLQDLASKVRIKELEGLQLKNTKNWIKVEDGSVKLSDLKTKVKDVQLTIDGIHPIEGPMNYSILVDIPSKYTQQYTKDLKLDKGIEYYNELMNKIGLNQKLSTDVNLDVQLTGTIREPKIQVGIKPKQGQGSAGSSGMAEVLTDSLKAAGSKYVDEAKSKAVEGAQKILDSAKTSVEKKLEEAGQKAKDEITKKLDTLVGSKVEGSVKQAVDSLGKKILPGGGQAVDSIKNKIKEWNPFKKKK